MSTYVCQHRKMLYDYVYEIAAEKGCVKCGEKDVRCLEWDHITGEKKNRIAKMISNKVSLAKLKEELAKCRPLCSNCHKKITARDFGHYSHEYQERLERLISSEKK